jgi:hypothetical protein
MGLTREQDIIARPVTLRDHRMPPVDKPYAESCDQNRDLVLNPWPAERFEAIFSANTAHIMSLEAVEAMFAGVGALQRVAEHAMPVNTFTLVWERI